MPAALQEHTVAKAAASPGNHVRHQLAGTQELKLLRSRSCRDRRGDLAVRVGSCPFVSCGLTRNRMTRKKARHEPTPSDTEQFIEHLAFSIWCDSVYNKGCDQTASSRAERGLTSFVGEAPKPRVLKNPSRLRRNLSSLVPYHPILGLTRGPVWQSMFSSMCFATWTAERRRPVCENMGLQPDGF